MPKEWRVCIEMSGRFWAAILHHDPALPWDDAVWIQRVGVRASPLKLHPGTELTIIAAPPEALRLAREHGFRVDRYLVTQELPHTGDLWR